MKILSVMAALILALAAGQLAACDACKLTDSLEMLRNKQDLKYRWSSDTFLDYRNFDRINPSVALAINDQENKHIHGVMDEWFITERIGYRVNLDLEVGISQGYRNLRQYNVVDPLLLGQHEFSNGWTDLELDAKWRFKRQVPDGFPLDLSLYGIVKFPTGETNERGLQHILIDPENQPGSGSWDGTLGMLASKTWGKWAATGSVSGTIRGEGTQNFKGGDSIRISVTGTRQVTPDSWSWKAYAGLGVQGFINFQGRINGEVDRNHGGQFIFLVPQVSVQPIERLSLTLAAPMPVYQEITGTHQEQDFGIQFNIGVRF